MKKLSYFVIAVITLFSALHPYDSIAQSSVNRDTILAAAREIILQTNYCALVTIDSTGQPQIRTMNPFPLKDELVIWFATSRESRKVSEIKNNPEVCVYYADHNNAKGYVNITGTAVIIDNKELLLKMKRAYWENIPNWQDRFVLIKITIPINIAIKIAILVLLIMSIKSDS